MGSICRKPQHLSETYVNYNTYFEHIKYCKQKGIKIYDQFGTIGDLSKENPRLGLHEFKKKFGGDYIEFIGEWDYIINYPMYFIFTKLVPIYRKIIKQKITEQINERLEKCLRYYPLKQRKNKRL